jgi:hypothetical protein
MTPAFLEKLCCGAVAGRVKFCALGATACGFTMHVKRVNVESNHLYVSSGQNSSFMHHHVPVSALAPDQVSALLKEQHSKEDWIHVFHMLNQKLVNSREAIEDAVSGFKSSVLEAITPGWKRKERYEDIKSLARR